MVEHAPRSARVTATLWQRPPRRADLPGFDAAVEDLHARLRAIGTEFRRPALASSLSAEDGVLTHAIEVSASPIEVFAIDTGRLPLETLAVLEQTQGNGGPRVQVVLPVAERVAQYVAAHGADAFYASVALRQRCCEIRKVEPLARALAGRDAWLTGQRRAQAPERAALAEREFDVVRGIAKFNPLAAWSDALLWYYVDRYELPVNALYARGYASIGCAPCTRAIRAHEEPRAGRWWWEQGEAKKECGLHVVPLTPDEAR
jgi:phosphoadenosine phosphosulfate reductase